MDKSLENIEMQCSALVMRYAFKKLFHLLFVVLSLTGAVNGSAAPKVEMMLTKVDLLPGCAISANLPSKTRIAIDEKKRTSASLLIEIPKNFKTKNYVSPLNLNFACYDSSEDNVQNAWAKLSENGDRWVLNMAMEELDQLNGAFHFYEIKSRNAAGWAITVDDTTGEENFRVRQIFYCLVRPPDAICGEGTMGKLAEIRKRPTSDLTDITLSILQSVEFLEDAKPLQVDSLPVLQEKKEGDFGVGCRVRLLAPSTASFRYSRGEVAFNGEPRPGTGWGNITLSGLSFPYKDTLNISFDCEHGSDARYYLARWVSLSCINKQWGLTEEGRESIEKGLVRLFDIQAKNAIGVAIVADDTREKHANINHRKRRVHFCLLHNSTTTCGSVDVGWLLTIRRNPLADLSPYVLDILRSIEFLDKDKQPLNCPATQ